MVLIPAVLLATFPAGLLFPQMARQMGATSPARTAAMGEDGSATRAAEESQQGERQVKDTGVDEKDHDTT